MNFCNMFHTIRFLYAWSILYNHSPVMFIISVSTPFNRYRSLSASGRLFIWGDIFSILPIYFLRKPVMSSFWHLNIACISFPTSDEHNVHILKFLGIFGFVYLPLSMGRLWAESLNLAIYLPNGVWWRKHSYWYCPLSKVKFFGSSLFFN